MVSFRETFERDFRSTKRVKTLTKEFGRIKPQEFKRIQKKLGRFK